MAYYVTIWQYDIYPSLRAAFEQAYGSDGEWATLFRRSSDYVRTDLLRDPLQSNRYLTLDYWQTHAAWVGFQTTYQREYAALDDHCSQLTRAKCILARSSLYLASHWMSESALGRRWLWLSYTIAVQER